VGNAEVAAANSVSTNKYSGHNCEKAEALTETATDTGGEAVRESSIANLFGNTVSFGEATIPIAESEDFPHALCSVGEMLGEVTADAQHVAGCPVCRARESKGHNIAGKRHEGQNNESCRPTDMDA
jgi:hypothetical protein